MMNFKPKMQELLDLAGIKINGNNPWDIKVHNPKLYTQVLSRGNLGIGEAYMAGWWDCEKLDEFFNKVLKVKLGQKIRPFGLIFYFLKARLFNLQSISKSKKVAEEHYDLGNDFYKDMLDKRMQYTCALWDDAKNLEEAQEKKLDLICRKLKLKKGEEVIELGGGWGGFAKYAAENYGCNVTIYNISKEQVKYTKEICKDLPVKVICADYRTAKGKFDKVVSIGMCEHVGYKNYGNFIKLGSKLLKKQGIFLIHTIGGNQSKKIADRWITKYIFPGGMIPSMKQLGKAFEGIFVLEDLHNIGPSYDKTLMAWYENFEKNWEKRKNDHSPEFYRMWKYYLLSCAGAFRARDLQLWQLVLSKNVDDYKSVR